MTPQFEVKYSPEARSADAVVQVLEGVDFDDELEEGEDLCVSWRMYC